MHTYICTCRQPDVHVGRYTYHLYISRCGVTCEAHVLLTLASILTSDYDFLPAISDVHRYT